MELNFFLRKMILNIFLMKVWFLLWEFYLKDRFVWLWLYSCFYVSMWYLSWWVRSDGFIFIVVLGCIVLFLEVGFVLRDIWVYFLCSWSAFCVDFFRRIVLFDILDIIKRFFKSVIFFFRFCKDWNIVYLLMLWVCFVRGGF